MTQHDAPSLIDSSLDSHYSQGHEATRLLHGPGEVERVRTQILLARYLPKAPATIYDVGGATGVHAEWLLEQGYKVSLVDPVARQIDSANKNLRKHILNNQLTTHVASACALPFEAESADAAILLGPLYHLHTEQERLAALQEAWRVLKPGGALLAAGVSRYATVLDFLAYPGLNPNYLTGIPKDIATGQHEKPIDIPEYFPTGYLHHPKELKSEVTKAGFSNAKVLPIESIILAKTDWPELWKNPTTRQSLLDLVETLENNEDLTMFSSHIMAIARKL